MKNRVGRQNSTTKTSFDAPDKQSPYPKPLTFATPDNLA